MRSDMNKIVSNNASMCHLIQVLCILCFVFWMLSFLIIKSHLLHVSYTARQQQNMNNKWLVEQCKLPEFYHNMKHHATLCDDLELQNQDSLWLHALRDVLDNSSICGPVHCDALFAVTISYMIDRLPFIMAFLIVVGMMSVVFCLPRYTHADRLRYKHVADVEGDWQRRAFITDSQYQLD